MSFIGRKKEEIIDLVGHKKYFIFNCILVTIEINLLLLFMCIVDVIWPLYILLVLSVRRYYCVCVVCVVWGVCVCVWG